MKIFKFIKKTLINKVLLLIISIYLAWLLVMISCAFTNAIITSFSLVLGSLLVCLIHNINRKFLLDKNVIVKTCIYIALCWFIYELITEKWEAGFEVFTVFISALNSLYTLFLTYMGLDFGNKITKSLQLRRNDND